MENIEVTEPLRSPVKGWLDRVDKDGQPEHIDFTVDEIRDAPNHYTDQELGDLKVEFSDGSIVRPYRFCATAVEIVHTVDPETGEIISHHF
jgi:hypothetical protein